MRHLDPSKFSLVYEHIGYNHMVIFIFHSASFSVPSQFLGQAMRQVTVGAIATSQAVSKMQSVISSVQKRSSKSSGTPSSRQSTKFNDSDEDWKLKMIPIVQTVSEFLKKNTISSSTSTASSLNIVEEKVSNFSLFPSRYLL